MSIICGNSEQQNSKHFCNQKTIISIKYGFPTRQQRNIYAYECIHFVCNRIYY